MDNENSAVHTEFTNIFGNNLKLYLKWSDLVGFCLNSSQNLIFTGFWSNNNSKEPSLTSLDLSSGKEYRRWDIMSSLGELLILLVFSLSNEALGESFLHQVIRLSSHGRLITQDTVGFNTHSINRNVHAVLDFNDVSTFKIVSVDGLFFTSIS